MNKKIFLAVLIVMCIGVLTTGFYAVVQIGKKRIEEKNAEVVEYCSIEDLKVGDKVQVTGSEISWTYMGKDETLVPLLVSTNPEAEFSITGKDFAGIEEKINEKCKELFHISDTRFDVRNITIQDVDRLLGYTDNQGEYVDVTVNPVYLKEPLTISALEARQGVYLYYRKLPQNLDKSFGALVCNFYTYMGSKYVKKSSEEYECIFKNKEYWLSSSAVEPYFHSGYVEYIVRSISKGVVGGNAVFISNGKECEYTCSLRPVIQITGEISVIQKDGMYVIE